MPKASIGGIDLFHEVTGPEGAPVVVFSNSVGSTLDIWDGVIPALSDRYRCVRYDTLGHGKSGSADKPITIDDLASHLEALLDTLGVASAHIVGLSLGGMTGQALASRKPGRVKSLTIVASTPYLPPVDFWTKRAATVNAEGPGAVVDQILGRWFTEPFRKAHPEAVAKVRARFMEIDRAGYGRCCEAIGAMDLRARLPEISAPTLIIVGAEDPVTTPEMAEGMRAAIPNAQLVVIPKAAHLISVERPDAVSWQILGFLNSVERA